VKADAKDLLRRNTGPWRAAFVVYALVLTTATHWPALDLGRIAGGGFESPDKILHPLAFAGLLVLLWRTRWVPHVWQAAVLVLAWTVIDELTQALPVLKRTFSVQDLVASQIGVVVAVMWIRALVPVGGPANRVRIAWLGFVIDDLFAHPLTWVLSGLAGLGGAVVVGTATWAIQSTVVPNWITIGGFAGGVGAGLAVVAAAVRRRARTLGVIRPCFACGTSCRDIDFGDDGRGACSVCGTFSHMGQWATPMVLPLSEVARGVGRAGLVGAGVFVAAMLVYVPVLRSWEGLLPDMQLTIDLALIAVAVAVAVRVYRGRQAVLYDRQHVCCRWCDHGLEGTEVTHGCGRCGECGTPFARFADG